MTFPAATGVPGGNRARGGLDWMAMTGLAMAVGERTILDPVWRDGRREPLPLDLVPTEARLRSHQVRLWLSLPRQHRKQPS